MGTDYGISSSQPSVPRPYVGLRPFEKHEREIFFGRDRDAQFLVDKVFAAKLTLLYAGSGLGKSSLLRTLVIPQLQENDSLVLYFDAWAGDTPEEALIELLVETATELGISNAAAGAPRPSELIRLIKSVDDRTVVLVLDQFEEFLVNHADRLDPLRSDLGAVVRATNLDVHILLSLREEFLAGLEPFQEELLQLFQSTYRLEPLPPSTIREVIERPAALFGRRYEPALLAQLERDLGPDEPDDAMELQDVVVELPLLQLVCAQLWDKMTDGRHTYITLGFYESLGGARAILQNYVKDVMPKRRANKKCVARLMQLLAPPSGLKMSYSIEDLVATTGLRANAVKAEMERLSNARILRIRQFRTGPRYELQHDAFIQIVEPWRNRILRRARAARRLRIVVGLAAAVAVFGVYVVYADRQQLYENTEGALGELREMNAVERVKVVEARFDQVAGYLLWQRSGTGRLETLKDLLKQNEDMLPGWYGVQRSGTEFQIFPEASWPMRIEYSSTRQLDPHFFHREWQSMAKAFAETWGIPVPAAFYLSPQSHFPKDLIRVTGPGGDTISMKLPTYEESAFITEQELPGPTREFFVRFQNDWTRIEEALHGGPWWIIPRWSLPVWKISGHLANDGSAMTALLLANHLLQNPEVLLTQEAVDLLLDRVADQYPLTVSEARIARGTRLRGDLAELVRSGQPLAGLPALLDALARFPEYDSKEVVALVVNHVSDPAPMSSNRLHGPWAHHTGWHLPVPSLSSNREGLYLQALSWLPSVEPSIRVYIGDEIVRELTHADTLSSNVSEALDKLRDFVLGTFGIALPPVRFRGDSWAPDMAPNALRIEMLNQTSEHPDAHPIHVTTGSALEVILDSLAYRATVLRTHLLSAELVSQLRSVELSRELDNWLDNRYSLTDLKTLLRYVVLPETSEIEMWANGEIGERRIGSTIRHLDWLLRSLVFWQLVDGIQDPTALGERLRQTQRAAMRGPFQRTMSGNQSPIEIVSSGIDALENDRFVEAEALFANAIESDGEEAARQFLIVYADRLNARISRALTEGCAVLQWVSMSRTDRIDLQAAFQLAEGSEARRLGLCLLAALPDAQREQRAALMKYLLEEHTNLNSWPLDEASWFGTAVVASHDPLWGDPEVLTGAQTLLAHSLERLSEPEAAALYRDMAERCYESGPKRWCWDLLIALAETRPTADILLELSWGLGQSERREYAELGLAATDEAHLAITVLPRSAENARRLDAVRYARAEALWSLVDFTDGAQLDRAQRAFEELLNSPYVGEFAHVSLANLQTARGELDAAERIVDQALSQWPRNVSLHSAKFFAELLQGNLRGASNTADSIIAQTGKGDQSLFVAALGLTLVRAGQWEMISREFLATDHIYVNTILMIVYATMVGEARDGAQHLLEERWNRINPKNWKRRSLAGDEGVWREMLIGYYVGHVAAEDIFGVLEDETAFDASALRHLPLPRRGMLCEAYFYDALLAQSRGDTTRMRARLQQTVELDHRNYYEHNMATFLLNQFDSSDHLTSDSGL